MGQTTATLATSLVILCACTSAPVQSPKATYPLALCVDDTTGDCIAPFFADSNLIASRTPEAFPHRYLELWDEEARTTECNKDASCIKRLERLNTYFNPLGKPDTGKIAIALEGGGNKSAPFALGVLAGINQMGLWDRVGAIGSVSGGTYAASFYFNRMLDLYSNRNEPPPTPEQVTRMRDAWFASCIPDALSDGRRYFENLSTIKEYRCGELGKPFYEFDVRYRYQQQVWMHADVLRLANDVAGDQDEALHLDDIGNLLALAGLTAVTVPYQFVARTIFRWPVNSSPSRFAYRVGLEREYGYSPEDWQSALTGDTPIWWHTLHVRRGERTLTTLATLADKFDTFRPNWIILSTAPGSIDPLAWAKPAPRDPIRQQFEITPTGFGSGTYGYARAHPDAPIDFFGANPNGLPIFDAVLASAAFFDDNEIGVSKQPFRLLGGAVQQFANVDWYSEVRNFNVSDRERTIERALTWPFYLSQTVKQSQTPYIHLQDGGNAENAGILPLLRRGYRRIVYAHGTTDAEAQLPAICHLKNQFEYDGNYYIVSRDLQDLIADRDNQDMSPIPAGKFVNYLDQLCSQQIDASDLAAFDANELREDVQQRSRAVAKVFCGRIGRYETLADVSYPRRAQPDVNYAPCEAYWRRFRYSIETGMQGGIALTFPVHRALFYQTSATPLRFHVCRGDALALTDAARGRRNQDLKKPLSTIIAVVPAVAWKDVAAQINPIEARADRKDWGTVCAASMEERRRIVVRECQAPDSSRLPPASNETAPEKLLPCGALAHVLEDKCKSIEQDGVDIARPEFPQDGVVRMTLHIPYPTYAAYFDLGRAQVHRALGSNFGDNLDDDDENACAIPAAHSDRVR
ncbi:MAG: hypothetical protein ABI607_01400 [Betaproteobacteria bacterium]